MNLKRVLEPVDLMVAAGIVALVIGAVLVFVSTQGRFQVTAADVSANGDASDPVQPALGQTVVAISLLESEQPGRIKTAATKLNQATMTARQINSSTHDHIKALAEQAVTVQVDNTARAELVKGRSIVNFTTRAMKTGSLSDQHWEEYDHRMIHSAAKAGRMIEEDFQQTKERNLGRAIVAETQGLMNATHRNQEQVGAAIVQVVVAQDEYEKALESAQEQLGLLVSVSAQAQL